jgi:uridine kinase
MIQNISREKILWELSEVINAIKLPHPVRVAVDGPGNAGKTTFANELKDNLEKMGRRVIRSTIDGFHNTAEVRYKKGKFSPRGYLEDSYNYPLLKKYLLDPFGLNGNLKYKDSIYNFKIDKPTNEKFKKAEKDAILVFDGIFLFKDEIINYWDYKIYISAKFENTMNRAIVRDSDLFGGKSNVIRLYEERYIPGHKMYLSMYNPIEASDIVYNNDDFQNPTVTRISNNNLHKELINLSNSQKELLKINSDL